MVLHKSIGFWALCSPGFYTSSSFSCGNILADDLWLRKNLEIVFNLWTIRTVPPLPSKLQWFNTCVSPGVFIQLLMNHNFKKQPLCTPLQGAVQMDKLFSLAFWAAEASRGCKIKKVKCGFKLSLWALM